MIKLTKITIGDRYAHDNTKSPSYTVDLVMKYYQDDVHHENQIEAKAMKFDKEFINNIAQIILAEYKRMVNE